MLIEVTRQNHGVFLDLAYATAANFTGAPVYGRAACYLHPHALDKLERARDLAAAIGLRLKVFDAFRPTEAQWALWNHTPDATFVADPRTGSTHGRGVAVDLTLTDETGAELDMGTGFDDFTPQSHHARTDISAAAQKNRALLLGLMTAAGWEFYMNEWWHYQLPDAGRKYPLLSDSVLSLPMMS
ncbi:D-alanyl-D-alanine dipeptidase [Oleispirillum naphthae]|uniref:D-alanyl-D-alanine dipeptidase n=1 Tax=Oleispirillum naphthae TaxID=2838853 RepID=UPI0030822365